MPKKRCNAPLCRTLIDFTQEYCSQHKPKASTKQATYSERVERDSEAVKFYKSKRWERTSRNYRYKQPLCERCLTYDLVVPADVVDHVKERKDLSEHEQHLLYDESNLMSLCHACHNRKTAQERAKRNE